MANVICQLVLCWLAADLATGLAHWAEDAYCGYPAWSWLRGAICGPNAAHHAGAPMAATYWGRCGSSYAAAALVVAPLAVACWLAGGVLPWQVAATAAIACQGNEVHGWAHRPHLAPGWAQLLQQAGLLLDPRQHAAHHRRPHLVRYCTLGNAVNAAADRWDVWSGLERAIARCGVAPRRVSA